MKICIIGPTYPFRGGISHYTTLLYRHLKKQHDTTFFAFKRQYPKWIYPGETDRDPSNQPLFESDVNYILDSLNPFSWIRLFKNLNKTNPDLVIFPWWTFFWTIPFYFVAKLVKKRMRSKILFICHNVKEHESKLFHRFCTSLVLNQGDYFIVHSSEEKYKLKKILPNKEVIKGFHPSYKALQGRIYDSNEAKKILNLDGRILLFFGFIRPYKGLKYLIEAMPIILKEIKITLLIVGECWDDKNKYKKEIKKIGINEFVVWVDRYIRNEEIGLYFAATDLVITPYISATGSGIIQTAFGCSRPVVATSVGGLSEVVKDGKTGYLVRPQDAEEIANAVIKFFKEKKSSFFKKNIENEIDKFSWGRLIKEIERGYAKF